MNNTTKYRWMKPYQRELYEDLAKEFDFKSLTDIGEFLELKNPYHGAKLIFEAQKQNMYLRKLVETKREANTKISELEETITQIQGFRSSIENSLVNLNTSLDAIKEIKKTLLETDD